ncbi:MAG: TRAP transporter small permease [Alphaproteobacteria bacterium]|jgi:TRAP-type C4-dicarboxylate transport system permease small subunit
MLFLSYSDKIAKSLMVTAAVWAFFLAFIILADIIARGVFNSPLHGTREIVANSIVIIVFLQAGYAIRSRSMLHSDMLLSRVPLIVKKIMLSISYSLGLFFFLVVITGSWDLAIQSWVENEYDGEGALKVPAWPTRFMIIVGGFLCCINYIALAVADIFEIKDVSTEGNMNV